MPQFAPWISPFLLSVSNPREKYDNCAWLKLTIAHLPTRLLTRLIINPFANIRGRITQLQNCVSWWKIGQVFERSPLFFLEFQVKIHIIRIYFRYKLIQRRPISSVMTSVRRKQGSSSLPVHQHYRHVFIIHRIYLSTRIQPNIHRPMYFASVRFHKFPSLLPLLLWI